MGSATRNNLERDASVTVFSTSTRSAGLSATLPGNLGATAQITSVRFSSQAPGAATVASRNRQISAGLSRAVSRHLLRLNWRDLKLAMAGATQRQRTAELEDMYHLGPLFAGGSVRLQSAAGADRRNSVFFRGRAQGNLGRFSAFANVELGNDLANRTIFAVSAYSTTALGLAPRISRDWNLQMEAFRNRLNMDLNPESAFVLAAGGAPIGRNLMDLNQWSLYFRLTRQIRWGGGLPQENLNQFTARNVPLTGVIEGYVRVLAGSTRLPAAGIPVMLDGYRTVSTGDDGRFRFEETPEGTHEVALSSRELPADYDPGALRNARVVVQPRRTARAELEVLPLLPLEGKIRGPEGVPLDGIIVRLLPGERYTNASADGVFVFYNLREGDYEVAIDPKSLPEGGELLSPRSVPAAVRTGAPVAPVHFSIGVNPQQKPIRKVLEIK